MTGVVGATKLTWLALRRDRVSIPAWVVGVSLFLAATTALFVSDFTDRAFLVEQTRIVASNTGMRLLGLSSGPTVGGCLLHREFITLAALAALLCASVVVRHTRQNEELGHAELVGAAVVGRYAPLVAAVGAAIIADLALAIGVTSAVLANGLPVTGSLLVGASVASVGLVFVGVAAVAVQVASTGRGATGICAAALGAAFLVSGVGNMLGSVDKSGTRVTSAWFTTGTPGRVGGRPRRVRPGPGVSQRHDPARHRGYRPLVHPHRWQRPAPGCLPHLDHPDGRDVRGDLRRPGVASPAHRRVRGDPGAGPGHPCDPGTVAFREHRQRRDRRHGPDALVRDVLRTRRRPDSGTNGRPGDTALVAALAQLPGVLLLGAVVVALAGLASRVVVPLSWTLLLGSLGLGPMFGPGLGLPQWILDASPFTHLPKAPANPVSVPQVVVLAGVCVALVASGVVAVRRRDLRLPA